MNNDRFKCRAWDVNNKCFYAPTYEAYRGKIRELSISFSGELFIRTMDAFIHESAFDKIGEGKFIIMQSPGLRDCTRNDEFPIGKLIYESDIMEYYEHGDFSREPEPPVLVAWDQGQCRFGEFYKEGTFPLDANPEYYKIIGNLHENPELLEDPGQ